MKNALAALRSEGRIDWRLTGRSSLFRLPCSTHPVREAAQASVRPSDGQKASIRKSESAHRNKAPLKDSLEEGGGGSSVLSTDRTSNQRARTHNWTDADDLALDFACQTDCTIRFDVQSYVQKHGIERLRTELDVLRGQRGLALAEEDSGTLVPTSSSPLSSPAVFSVGRRG